MVPERPVSAIQTNGSENIIVHASDVRSIPNAPHSGPLPWPINARFILPYGLAEAFVIVYRVNLEQ